MKLTKRCEPAASSAVRSRTVGDKKMDWKGQGTHSICYVSVTFAIRFEGRDRMMWDDTSLS
jgi:hypothetical protein